MGSSQIRFLDLLQTLSSEAPGRWQPFDLGQPIGPGRLSAVLYVPRCWGTAGKPGLMSVE